MKVYSIVRDKRPDLKDGWAWEISNAVVEESRRYGLDPILVLAIINVESRFQHGAVSTEGARGLMQVRPIVVRALAEERDLEPWAEEKSLDDPVLNIRIGVQYLHSLKRDFRDLRVALTAYNWGPTEIRNRLEEDEMLPLEYAMKVLSTYHSYHRRISPR